MIIDKYEIELISLHQPNDSVGIWINKEDLKRSGEAMCVPKEEFYKLIDDFFKEKFH